METVSVSSAYFGHLGIFSIRVTPAYGRLPCRTPSCLPSFLRFKSHGSSLYHGSRRVACCVGDRTWRWRKRFREDRTRNRVSFNPHPRPLLENKSYWIMGGGATRSFLSRKFNPREFFCRFIAGPDVDQLFRRTIYADRDSFLRCAVEYDRANGTERYSRWIAKLKSLELCIFLRYGGRTVEYGLLQMWFNFGDYIGIRYSLHVSLILRLWAI